MRWLALILILDVLFYKQITQQPVCILFYFFVQNYLSRGRMFDEIMMKYKKNVCSISFFKS